MFSVSFLLIGMTQLVFLAGFVRVLAVRRRPADLIPAVLTVMLAYDNAVIGAGRWIGEGELLRALNLPRFAGHALLTPLLLVWGLSLLRRASIARAARPAAAAAVWAVALALIAYDASFDVFGVVLEPERWAGTLRYVNTAAPPGPPVAAVLTCLGLLAAGVRLLIATGSRRLLVAALVMTAASALAARAPIAGNIGEAVLVAGILAAARPRSDSPEEASRR
ncbi:hypothetical protein [Planomonospora venezuelensis]|uniref:Uncharacterized protein n=1 Tax=Planomonospora venezuelensis TaxID=1999 RepID=A0A841D975_PLAVE|nr:hypothetical protein [Planomonospora venezuelensis]MBB5966510.1 hypothetical protein [Planomonospora venezuelensis]GIN02312.1 hypothetical protein Pve01_39700 [Planomonospora venezuelensis]